MLSSLHSQSSLLERIQGIVHHLRAIRRQRRQTLLRRAVEPLEHRSLLSNIVVTTVLDVVNDADGKVSLREAIATANGNGVPDTITFAPHVTGTINLTLGQFTISGDTVIQGPGADILTLHAKFKSRHFQVDVGTSVEIQGIKLTGGSGGSGGGAINNEGKLTLQNMWLTNNSADFGGAINNGSSELGVALTIVNCTLSSNYTQIIGAGGAICNTDKLTVINSTLSNNSCYGWGYGGGIYQSGASAATTVINSTITLNSADSDGTGNNHGGGIALGGGTFTLHNSIVAGNHLDLPYASDIAVQGSGSLDGFNNLIGDATSAGGLTHGGQKANIVGMGGVGIRPIDSILNTTLAANGGPVPTHALVAGSIAIDNGNTVHAVDQNGTPLAVDQRGSRRVLDGVGDGLPIVDIGAVESGPVAVNGLLSFDASNGSFRLGSLNGDTLDWFHTGSFGTNQLGFIADFNGDGRLDGMLFNTTTLRFNFLRNKGDGTLAAPVSAGALNDSFTWGNFMVGDYDGNGRAEVMAQILAGPSGVGSMRSQDANGVNKFYIKLDTGFDAMVTGDFNGDGYDDIVGLFDNAPLTQSFIIPAYSISTPVGRRMTAVLGSGQFGQSVAANGLHNILVEDFNGDGRADLSVVNSNGQVLTATTVGNARNNAQDVRNFVVSNASPRFTPTQYGNPILSGSFDGNLQADLFTVRNNGQLITSLSTVAINGTPVQTIGIAGVTMIGQDAVIGDFNGDGREDVILLGTTAARRLSLGATFDAETILGDVIDGPIGSFGTARAGRVI